MPNINLKKVYKMNKILLALGLIATIALVGCNKDKAPETGATTGEHVENAVDQAKHDVENATKDAASATAQAADHAANATATAVDHAADATVDAAKNATATAAGAVEKGAADVKEKAQQ